MDKPEWFDIAVGQRITVTLPGVPAWNVPEVVQSARVTAENVSALRDDVRDQMRNGGATLRTWEVVTLPADPGIGRPRCHAVVMDGDILDAYESRELADAYVAAQF